MAKRSLWLLSVVIKIVYKIAHRFRKIWWRMRKTQSLGVKVIVKNQCGEILLVKPSYATTWQIPGGGVEHYEHPQHAGVREIYEETGVTIAESALMLEDVFISKHEGKSDCVILYTASVKEQVPIADGKEIESAAFFSPTALPPDVAGSVRLRLNNDRSKGIW